MKYFVTGATGFIGHELVRSLLLRGDKVNVLIRSTGICGLPETGNLMVFRGNLNEKTVIERGMTGCDGVFHMAAYANIWSRDKNLSNEVNVTGTLNILEAALKTNVKRVVFTSSAGTLRPSLTDEAVDENDDPPADYLTDYERTKFQAEMLCRQYGEKGLDVVMVNPSRVYGPGLMGKSNSVTRIIKLYIDGKWRVCPGDGNAIGNYVYIGDVVDGHIKAMETGVKGEKYILGGENATFNQFIEKISLISGKKYRLINIPVSPILVFARFSLFTAEKFKIKPLITPVWIKKLMQNRVLSTDKACKKLNYRITPLEAGISETVKWLKQINSKNE